jgi:hypothetical protein
MGGIAFHLPTLLSENKSATHEVQPRVIPLHSGTFATRKPGKAPAAWSREPVRDAAAPNRRKRSAAKDDANGKDRRTTPRDPDADRYFMPG